MRRATPGVCVCAGVSVNTQVLAVEKSVIFADWAVAIFTIVNIVNSCKLQIWGGKIARKLQF